MTPSICLLKKGVFFIYGAADQGGDQFHQAKKHKECADRNDIKLLRITVQHPGKNAKCRYKQEFRNFADHRDDGGENKEDFQQSYYSFRHALFVITLLPLPRFCLYDLPF